MRTPPRSPGIMDHLEAFLAKITGRAKWPFTAAFLESELSINSSSATARSSGSVFTFFTYEVEGRIYSSAVRRYFVRAPIFRFHERFPRNAKIQYDPQNPARTYYAPACTYAYTFVAILWMMVIAAGVLLFHRYQ